MRVSSSIGRLCMATAGTDTTTTAVDPAQQQERAVDQHRQHRPAHPRIERVRIELLQCSSCVNRLREPRPSPYLRQSADLCVELQRQQRVVDGIQQQQHQAQSGEAIVGPEGAEGVGAVATSS